MQQLMWAAHACKGVTRAHLQKRNAANLQQICLQLRYAVSLHVMQSCSAALGTLKSSADAVGMPDLTLCPGLFYFVTLQHHINILAHFLDCK